jgi:dipeptidyl aminopeptidase/acylaminoacyl peptidase
MRSLRWARLALAAGLVGGLLLGLGQARDARADAPALRTGADLLRALREPSLARLGAPGTGRPEPPWRQLGPPPLGGEIYAMNADGSGQVNLTNSQADDYSPAWSPDGTKIAFTRYEGGPGAEIYVMNADGTNQVNLTNDPADDSAPAWSPDGTKIAFTRLGGADFEIYVMDVTDVGEGVDVLAELDGDPVLLRQSRFLVASFHPELTDDTRVHQRFLDLVREETHVGA